MDNIESAPHSYALAGWLAIISAVLIVPEIGLAFLAGFISSGFEILVLPIHIANTVIGIYILYMFRKLLNRQFDFHATDVLITILILVNVVFSLIGLVSITIDTIGLGSEAESNLSLITMALFVPFSLLTIAFGVMLLKLKDDLFGLLQPYAYTTIVSGVCGATILLAPIGLLAAVVALVMLGMVFLRANREAAIL